MIHEFIEQVRLTGEDRGQEGFGVVVELTEGLELGEHFQPQEVGFVDDESRSLFSLSDFQDECADGFGVLVQGISDT